MAADKTAKAFGVILRELRTVAQISQERLALEADRDRTFVGKLERGLKLPTLETVFRLASVLDSEPGAMVDKVAALVDPAPRKRAPANRTALVAFGEETCSRCKAVYKLHVRRLPSPRKGKFRCSFCKQELSASTGRVTHVYTVLHPPSSWRKR